MVIIILNKLKECSQLVDILIALFAITSIMLSWYLLYQFNLRKNNNIQTKNNNKKNKLFIISGHSGSGKSSIMKSLMDNELISFTTRPKREGEVEGKDYYFISEEEYKKMLENDELVECTYYSGNYYGLTKEELENKLALGHAFVIVDYIGATQLLDLYDNCVTIMLHTSKEDAVQQMKDRGDSIESIRQRMLTYHNEIENKQYYDYVVINRYGHFNKTREIVKTIIEMETAI